MMFYVYIEKLHHTERDFWESSILKVSFLCDQYMKELEAQAGQLRTSAPAKTIQSMKDIPGW